MSSFDSCSSPILLRWSPSSLHVGCPEQLHWLITSVKQPALSSQHESSIWVEKMRLLYFATYMLRWWIYVYIHPYIYILLLTLAIDNFYIHDYWITYLLNHCLWQPHSLSQLPPLVFHWPDLHQGLVNVQEFVHISRDWEFVGESTVYIAGNFRWIKY